MRANPAFEAIHPAAGWSRPDEDPAATMARDPRLPAQGTAADLLRSLRAAYPDSPLAVRVRALAALQAR